MEFIALAIAIVAFASISELKEKIKTLNKRVAELEAEMANIEYIDVADDSQGTVARDEADELEENIKNIMDDSTC